MKPSFKQFHAFITAPAELEEEVLAELFGVFKNNNKPQADKMRADLMAKKKALDDRKWAAAKAASEAGTTVKSKAPAYGQSRADDFDYAVNGAVKECFGEHENDDVLVLVQDLVNGSVDLYDVMHHPVGPTQKKVAVKLRKWYDEVAGEHGLSADDDFDEIKQLMLDELESYSLRHPPAVD